MSDPDYDFAVQNLHHEPWSGVDWASPDGDETVFLVMRLDENDGQDRSTHRMIAGFAADCLSQQLPETSKKIRRCINLLEEDLHVDPI